MSSIQTALEEARQLVATLEAACEKEAASEKKPQDEDMAVRLQLVNQTEHLLKTLQRPMDTVARLMSTFAFGGAFNTILGIRAYHAVPADGSSISADELARQTNVAPTVIHRIFRVAVNNGVFVETRPDTYAHNDYSRALHPIQGMGSFFMIACEFGRAWIHLPEYLKSHVPDDIFDLRKSPAVFSVGRESLGKTYYELLDADAEADPERRAAWDANMLMVDMLMPLVGMFPFASLKEAVEQQPERPFFVDIGGGAGQSCVAVQKDIAGVFEGKFVLQDLPSVVGRLQPETLPGVEFMAYDAFTPQPVKNAHVYFMRRFLHDFYPSVCKEFVKNTASAMGPDSRLIICDMLVPEKVDTFENMDLYWLDFALMCMTGQEKTKATFDEILDAAGLKIVKIYPSSYGKTVMIEAMLKK